jgi:hypothetical protein
MKKMCGIIALAKLRRKQMGVLGLILTLLGVGGLCLTHSYDPRGIDYDMFWLVGLGILAIVVKGVSVSIDMREESRRQQNAPTWEQRYNLAKRRSFSKGRPY